MAMIALFGASSDIGRRVAGRLLDRGAAVRVVARDITSLDARAERVTGTIADAATVTADAEIVVSCAHAQFTRELLKHSSKTVRQFVLVGSAWRYSRIPNVRADEVRRAEADFLGSGRNGVMLHPTMIYGGVQENNIQRLVSLIRRSPVIPLPGGGRHLVQPIHVDDVAQCIVSAIDRLWHGPRAIAIAGPAPIQWCDMAQACVDALGCRRLFLPLPLGPAIALLSLMRHMGIGSAVDPNVLRRFRENVSVSVTDMQSDLAVVPRSFAAGIREALDDWGAKGSRG